MSLLHDGAFMAQFEQSKVEVKQQMNIMIEGIYAKVLLNLVQWLNKDNRNVENINNSSVHKLTTTNHNDETEMELTIPNCLMSMHENVNRPLSPPSPPLTDHPQPHSTVLSIKNEIDSDCEQNITDNNNLPSEASDLQPIPSKSLQPIHSRSDNSSNEIVSHNEVEVDYRDEIQYDLNDQQSISANDREYLFANNEIYDNVEFPNEKNNELLESYDYSEAPNELSQNALTQQPSSESNEKQIYFEEEDDYDQELLDQVKREIEEEEELKRKENESKDREKAPNGEGEQVESELQTIDTQETIESNDQGQCNNNTDESMIIQQTESNTTSAIEESIANESTIFNQIQQPNHAQSNVPASNNPLQIDPCPESYNHKYLFMKHNRQNIDRPFEHERAMHSHDDSLLCVDCGKEFSRKLILKAHRRVHCRPY